MRAEKGRERFLYCKVALICNLGALGTVSDSGLATRPTFTSGHFFWPGGAFCNIVRRVTAV